jgi:hypothetical protein
MRDNAVPSSMCVSVDILHAHWKEMARRIATSQNSVAQASSESDMYCKVVAVTVGTNPWTVPEATEGTTTFGTAFLACWRQSVLSEAW